MSTLVYFSLLSVHITCCCSHIALVFDPEIIKTKAFFSLRKHVSTNHNIYIPGRPDQPRACGGRDWGGYVRCVNIIPVFVFLLLWSG